MGTCGGSVAAEGFLLWADLSHGPSRRILASGPAQHVLAHCPLVFTPPFPTTQKVAQPHPAGPHLPGSVEGPGK